MFVAVLKLKRLTSIAPLLDRGCEHVCARMLCEVAQIWYAGTEHSVFQSGVKTEKLGAHIKYTVLAHTFANLLNVL